jgi:hypothetical protein
MSEAKFMTDSQGRQVPMDMVRDIDKLRDQTVRTIAEKALAMRDTLAVLKQELRGDLLSYPPLSAERFGKTYGGKKGNITLMSYDGSLRLVLSVNEHIVF